jgi:hypothetical protein
MPFSWHQHRSPAQLLKKVYPVRLSKMIHASIETEDPCLAANEALSAGIAPGGMPEV